MMMMSACWKRGVSTCTSSSATLLLPRFAPTSRYFSTISNTGVKAQSTKDYCVDLVYRNDHDSYLAGILFPKEHRSAYYALKAFKIAMATIRDQIPKNAMLAGKSRFQFWRDILTEIQQHQRLPSHINHPVAIELLQHIMEYKLTIRWLERCLEAR